MPQALGIVDIFVSGKPSEHRLPQQPDQSVTAIPAGACVGEHVPGHRAETEGVVELTVGQQSGIGGDPGAMELELQPAVEKSSLREPSIDSPVGCAMTVHAVQFNLLIVISDSSHNHIKFPRHPANTG